MPKVKIRQEADMRISQKGYFTTLLYLVSADWVLW